MITPGRYGEGLRITVQSAAIQDDELRRRYDAMEGQRPIQLHVHGAKEARDVTP